MRGWPNCNSPRMRRSEVFYSGAVQLEPNRVPRETGDKRRRSALKPAAASHIALAIAAIVLCGAVQIAPAKAKNPSTNQIID
jgi:hypothetical protein